MLQELAKQAESRFQESTHPEKLIVYVGARLIILDNLSVKLSLTNGAQCTVMALASSFIQVRVNKTGLAYNLERKCPAV